MAVATAAAVAGLAATGLTTGMSIGQAVKQKRAMKEANAAAAKSMAEARKRLDVNVYESLGIPKEGSSVRDHFNQRLCKNNPKPCQSPQIKKFRVIPCHRPINSIVLSCPIRMMIQVGIVRGIVRNLRVRGLK